MEKLELTVGMIKPDAVEEGNAEAIFARIKELGFTVIRQTPYHMTYDQAKAFYSHLDLKYQQYFEGIYKFISSGPMIVFAMTGHNVISRWREEMGPSWPPIAKKTHPESLRAKYGSERCGANAVHGAISPAEVVRQLEFFEWDDLIVTYHLEAFTESYHSDIAFDT